MKISNREIEVSSYNILAQCNAPYSAITVLFKKGSGIIPAGTILGGVGGNSLLESGSLAVAYATADNSATSEGILFKAVDTTNDDQIGTMVTTGSINLDITEMLADANGVPTDESRTALKNITFVRRGK